MNKGIIAISVFFFVLGMAIAGGFIPVVSAQPGSSSNTTQTGSSTTTTSYYSVTTATTTATQTTSTSSTSGTAYIDVNAELCQSGTCTPYSTTIYLLPANSLCGSTSGAMLISGTGTNGYLAMQVGANAHYTVEAAGGGYLTSQCQQVSVGAPGSVSQVTFTFTSTGYSVIGVPCTSNCSALVAQDNGIIGVIFFVMGALVLVAGARKK